MKDEIPVCSEETRTNNIPNAILRLLHAIKLLIETEALNSDGKDCIYKKYNKCDTCVYGIQLTSGDESRICLYELCDDAITSMTEE